MLRALRHGMANLRFEGFRETVGFRICWTGRWCMMALATCIPVVVCLGTRPTIFANVSGLAGSFGIQLSGWARRMCSQMER